MKTVLAPGAPWPKPEDFKRHRIRLPKVNLGFKDLDFFAKTHNELLDLKKKPSNSKH